RVEAPSAHPRGAVGEHHRPQSNGTERVERPGIRTRQQAHLLLQAEERQQAGLLALGARGGRIHARFLLLNTLLIVEHVVERGARPRPARCRPDAIRGWMIGYRLALVQLRTPALAASGCREAAGRWESDSCMDPTDPAIRRTWRCCTRSSRRRTGAVPRERL